MVKEIHGRLEKLSWPAPIWLNYHVDDRTVEPTFT